METGILLIIMDIAPGNFNSLRELYNLNYIMTLLP